MASLTGVLFLRLDLKMLPEAQCITDSMNHQSLTESFNGKFQREPPNRFHSLSGLMKRMFGSFNDSLIATVNITS